MRNWSAVVLVMGLSAPAFADATADARAHDEAFAKACAAGDVKAVVALYTDDAFVIWPGAGEEARGKAAIEKLVAGLCDPKLATKPVIKSDVGVQLDPSHIAIIGHWELTQTGSDARRRRRDPHLGDHRKNAAVGATVDHARSACRRPSGEDTSASEV